MQIFKNFLLACSLAVATSPFCLSAADNDAQTAARAALQQKMRELQGLPPTAEAPANTPHSDATPMPTPAAPVIAPPPNPPTTPEVQQGAAPDLIEQARQATRARMNELQGNPATAIPAGEENAASKSTRPSKEELRAAEKRAAAEQAAAARKAAKEVELAAPPKSTQPAFAEVPGEPAASATSSAQPTALQQKAAAKAAKKANKEVIAEPPIVLAPMEAPASSLPASKEEALKRLTEQYQADQISAEQYHEQRAKILAEP